MVSESELCTYSRRQCKPVSFASDSERCHRTTARLWPRRLLRQTKSYRQGFFWVSLPSLVQYKEEPNADESLLDCLWSEVYKGFSKITRQPVAIKIIDLENAEDEIDDIQQEIAILSQLDSEHVTKWVNQDSCLQTYLKWQSDLSLLVQIPWQLAQRD